MCNGLVRNTACEVRWTATLARFSPFSFQELKRTSARVGDIMEWNLYALRFVGLDMSGCATPPQPAQQNTTPFVKKYSVWLRTCRFKKYIDEMDDAHEKFVHMRVFNKSIPCAFRVVCSLLKRYLSYNFMNLKEHLTMLRKREKKY
jgi:hypothetical protein